jgi:hypothetical protein
VPDGPEQVDVLENGTAPSRRLVTVLVVLALVVAGFLWLRDRAADREQARRIDVVASLAVESSSTSPPGGRVSYFVLVRNDGEEPVVVTAVDGGDDGVLLRMLDDHERTVPAGAQLSIPLSVRLTCAGAGTGRGPLPADLALRRADGSGVTRPVGLEPAVLVRDVAGTLCAVRPGLRDHELSGRVFREIAGKGDTGG